MMVELDNLTVEEVEALYPNEWVLLLDPEIGPDLRVKRGWLAYHGVDRDELHKVAMEVRPKSSAVWHTGEDPEDELILL